MKAEREEGERLRAELSDRTADAEATRAQLDEARRLLAALQGRFAQLEAEHARCDDRAEALARLEGRLADMQGTLADRDRELEGLRAVHAELTTRVESDLRLAREAAGQLGAERDALRDDLKHARDEVGALTAERDALLHQASRLGDEQRSAAQAWAEAEGLRTRLEAAIAECDRAGGEGAALAARCSALEQSLAERDQLAATERAAEQDARRRRDEEQEAAWQARRELDLDRIRDLESQLAAGHERSLHELDLARDGRQRLDHEHSALREQHATALRDRAELARDRDRLLLELKALQDRQAESQAALEEALASSREELGLTRDRNQAAAAELATRAAQIAGLREALRQAEERSRTDAAAFEERLDALSIELDSAREAEARFRGLAERWEHEAQVRGREAHEATRRADESGTRLRDREVEWERSRLAAEAEGRELRETVRSLEAQLVEARRASADRTEQAEALREQQERNAALERALVEIEETSRAVRAALAEAETVRDDERLCHSAAIADLRTALAEAREAHERSEAERTRLADALETEQRLAGTHAESARSHGDEVERLRHQLAALERRREADAQEHDRLVVHLREELGAEQTRRAGERDELDRLRRAIAALEADHEAALRDREQLDEHLRAVTGDFDQRSARLTAERDAARSEVAAVRAELERIRGEAADERDRTVAAAVERERARFESERAGWSHQLQEALRRAERSAAVPGGGPAPSPPPTTEPWTLGMGTDAALRDAFTAQSRVQVLMEELRLAQVANRELRALYTERQWNGLGTDATELAGRAAQLLARAEGAHQRLEMGWAAFVRENSQDHGRPGHFPHPGDRETARRRIEMLSQQIGFARSANRKLRELFNGEPLPLAVPLAPPDVDPVPGVSESECQWIRDVLLRQANATVAIDVTASRP